MRLWKAEVKGDIRMTLRTKIPEKQARGLL